MANQCHKEHISGKYQLNSKTQNGKELTQTAMEKEIQLRQEQYIYSDNEKIRKYNTNIYNTK